jgi:hypothetical protein
MNTLAKMKSQLVELEVQKKKLKTEIELAGKRFKLSLWLAGGGVALLPLYGAGVVLILAGGLMAMVVNERKNKLQEKLADTESQIHQLELSMG